MGPARGSHKSYENSSGLENRPGGSKSYEWQRRNRGVSGREQLEGVPPVAGGKMSLDRKIEPPKSQSEVGAVWGGGCGRGDLKTRQVTLHSTMAMRANQFTQLIVPQSVSKHTVRTSQANGVSLSSSLSLSSPEIPIDMSGRRCSGRITSQFVKT
ncbi:hypothetical protein BO83DRAFT_6039 [Aspergillus eucalypticola CBS 122712]|uniref:Uncharacterized protein n=1 Tax=Aspergillus eucalypticola (strain CBS 122712 / IBT 29274) TaxID=1448314 RepID=A0A317WJW4_ASPEC|nr:uncharacterized protein BO83DRAFT_6039 [Aspergillus eucalypticola CBS 122712]PWY85358.1 hypothetical protein BO83DRAFT_6039 [Aspergillus eucalypticola CBS 122712]